MERVLFKEAYRVYQPHLPGLHSVSLTYLAVIVNLSKSYRVSSVRPPSPPKPNPADLHRATMDSGPNGDSFLAPRMLPDPDEGGDYHWPSYCRSTNAPIYVRQIIRLTIPIVAHPIRIRTTPSLWCSAACPTGTKALFAVGTSDGLHTLEGFGSHWLLSQKPFPNERIVGNEGFRRHGSSSHASVSAVEWLSSDVIVSGLRNSTVFLHDLRSGGSATRLQHPHSVAKIRKVDQYRLVVGGHNSVSRSFFPIFRANILTPRLEQLQMYDIRFAPNGIQRKPKPNAHHHTSTRPYLSFPDYSPDVIPDFDVSTELNLLASGTFHSPDLP